MGHTKWSEIKKQKYIQGIYNILAYKSNGVPLLEVAEEVFNYIEQATKKEAIGELVEEAVLNEKKSTASLRS